MKLIPTLRYLIVLICLLGVSISYGQKPKPSAPKTPNTSSTKTLVAAQASSIPPSVIIQNLPPTPAPSPWWKDFPWTFFAAIIAGGSAIGTALIARNTAEKKRTSDENIAADRKRQDSLHFARKEQQDQFIDIQNRLEKETPFVRANAALRLAGFAMRPDPEQEIFNNPIARNDKSFPYFLPSASLLTNALYLEPEQSVRHSITEALILLTRFAKDSEQAELLYRMLDRLIEINRLAKAQFIKFLAAWSVTLNTGNKVSGGNLSLAATITRFCLDKEVTEFCILSLMQEGEERTADGLVKTESNYAQQCHIATSQRAVLSEQEKNNHDALCLPQLERSSKQLADVCYATANLLKLLPNQTSQKVKQSEIRTLRMNLTEALNKASLTNNESDSDAAELNIIRCAQNLCNMTWRTNFADGLRMTQVFLAGADLAGANLQRVDLSGAHLQGANLESAHLEDADLTGGYMQRSLLSQAYLQGARLQETHLESATLYNAQLQGADIGFAFMKKANLAHAQLQGAYLRAAQLQDSDFIMADLHGAYLEAAQLQKADFNNANLKGTSLRDTRLESSILFEIKVLQNDTQDCRKTDFTNSSWAMAESIDEELKTWLEQFVAA